MNRRAASAPSCSDSGPRAAGNSSPESGNNHSPRTPSRTRDVAQILSPGTASSSRSARRGRPSTFSALSNTRTMRRNLAFEHRSATISCCGLGARSSAEASRATACEVLRRSSRGNQSASVNRGAWRRIASLTRRLLPTPPGPVTVSNRHSGRPRSTTSSSISRARPTNPSGPRSLPVALAADSRQAFTRGEGSSPDSRDNSAA